MVGCLKDYDCYRPPNTTTPVLGERTIGWFSIPPGSVYPSARVCAYFLLHHANVGTDFFSSHSFYHSHAEFLFYGATNFEFDQGIPTEIGRLTNLGEYR